MTPPAQSPYYTVLAADLGAESGRIMQIAFDGRAFEVRELQRFPNIPVRVHQTLYWDVLRLWNDVKSGIDSADRRPDSIGVDTWGVDFALLDRDGNLLANPVHYRDARTDGMMEWVFERVPRRDVFERTGIQFMQLNTLFQIASLARANSPVLEMAHTFLLMPDLLNSWLTGTRQCEFTNVTTTQMYNPVLGDWDREMLATLGVPTHIFPQIVQPGTRLGEYDGVPVIAPATHDTASAVVAVPTTTDNFAFLSSGTWSLFGLELDRPVITEETYRANVTNEGGAYGTFTFLKNVVGLWIAQQCRATWRAEGHEYSYDDLVREASQARPFQAFIDPDDPLFIPHGDMPARIREYCQRTGQYVPQTVGETIRTAYESLALKYRLVIDCLAELTGRTVDRLHIVGGGARNKLLNQMAANATGRQVVAGPYEGTALGNGIVQLIELGALANIAEARDILSRTIETSTYDPQDLAAWDEHYQRYRAQIATS